MNRAQVVRLWSLVGLWLLQFLTIIAIDSSAHNAAVPVGVTSGAYNSGSVSSVYTEVGFSIVVLLATAIVAGFTFYRYLHPLPPTVTVNVSGPRDWTPDK